ncbi:MAG: hypothetical protein ACREYF_06925 [Gammaproteobacteria bacterium]
MRTSILRGNMEGTHFIADLTLPYGRVIHDYLTQATGEISYARTA